MDTGTEFIRFVTAEFAKAREFAERAVEQMPAGDLAWRPDERGNSVSMLMRHLGGNLRSRFTDLLTTDGEKPDRDRDSEFRNDVTDREAMLAKWRAGWECLDRALAELEPADLNRTIAIRGEPHTVLQALLRAVTHTSYHVGQIVDLARTRAADWQTLSIPRPPSESPSLRAFPPRSGRAARRTPAAPRTGRRRRSPNPRRSRSRSG